MNISSNHPTVHEFISNELRTLNFLGSKSFIQKHFSPLHSDALNAYTNQNISGKKTQFEFHTSFDFNIEKRKRKVVIEIDIRPKYERVSYCLCFCETNSEPYNAIRKFHFDFALAQQKTNFPVPVYHLQYGGDTSPYLTSSNVSIASLQPWLSVPRIINTPINLALLIDYILNEFASEETVTIANRKEWKDLIKQNEDLLLVPYYKGLNQFIARDHKSTYLIREFCYGR